MREPRLSIGNDKFLLRRLRKFAAVVGLVSCHVLQGCVHEQPLNSTFDSFHLPPVGKIALTVKAPRTSEILAISDTGRLVEAGRGATRGSVLGGVGIICYWGAIICVPVLAGVGSIGGAVYGGIVGDTATQWENFASRFRTILVEANLDRQISAQIVDYARSNGYEIDDITDRISSDSAITPSRLLLEGYKALLEVDNLSVNLIPAELMVNPARQFVTQAHVRLTRTSGVILVDHIIYDEFGTTRPVTEWLDDKATHFSNEVPSASGRLGERIVDKILLEVQLPEVVSPLNLAWEVHSSMPAIVSPEILQPNQSSICTRQPTVRWRELDRDDVRYELRIWKAFGDRVGPVVYHRENLDDDMHTLEEPLEGSTNYLISVRARFKENGQNRVTDWGRYTLEPTSFSNIMFLGAAPLFSSFPHNSLYPCRTPY